MAVVLSQLFASAASFDTDSHLKTLRDLVDNPLVDPSWHTASTPQALTVAASQGNLEGLRILLPRCDASLKWEPPGDHRIPKSAENRWGSDSKGITALMAAAKKGHADCVAALLPASDANARDQDGATALMRAAKKGHLECVKLLLPASNPDQVLLNSDDEPSDTDGDTALILAARHGHAACAQALAAVSDVGHENALGRNALEAAVLNDNLECAQALVAPTLETGVAGRDGFLSSNWWEEVDASCARTLDWVVSWIGDTQDAETIESVKGKITRLSGMGLRFPLRLPQWEAHLERAEILNVMSQAANAIADNRPGEAVGGAFPDTVPHRRKARSL